jgi:hypothetical protein
MHGLESVDRCLIGGVLILLWGQSDGLACVANYGVGCSCRDCPCLAWPWTMVLDAAIARRVFDLTQKPLFAAPVILRRLRGRPCRTWIIYAVFGVLVCLLLWRVAIQWKVKSAEAKNLRASLTILGVVALALIVWQCATVPFWTSI